MENQNTKKCPFCGEEILESAIKCRYCHSWLDGRDESSVSAVPPAVPVVAEPVETVVAETVVPSASQSSASAPAAPQVVIVNNAAGAGTGMSKEEASDLYEKKKEQEESNDSLLTETFIVSALFGWLGPYPWWSGIIMFLVAAFLCAFRFLRIILCLIFIGIWAAIGYGIGSIWDSETLGAIIAGVLSLICHWGAMRKQV